MIIWNNMGGPKWYRKEPGHTDNRYHSADGIEKVTINGITGCIIENDKNRMHTSLPAYSNSSDMYFRYGPDGKTVVQCALYINRIKICDFDWGHKHVNKSDGKIFNGGTVHVQFYGPGEGGSRVRINEGDARFMNNAEIEKYGAIINHFNQNVKFRP